MTFQTDDFADRELSLDELETIAAGWPHWVHSIVHGIESAEHSVASGLKSFFTNPVVAGVAGAIIGIGAIITGGNALKQN